MSKNCVQPPYFLIAAVILNCPSLFAATYTITVNGADRKGSVPHFWSECVGTGTMCYCLKPEWQTAAKIGAEEAGFKRFRGHGILMGWNNVDRVGIFHWNGTGTPTYTWATFDTIYDFIVKTCKMQPIVELSFMPKDLQTNGQTSPPKDLNVYRDMIREIVSHCITRYGAAEVRSWYWEVWNEWDYSGFWNGTEAQYYQMYQKAVEGAKSADAEIRIGGPASTNSGKLQGFLNYCTANNVKFDFLSNHFYGGGGSGPGADPVNIRNDNRTRADVIKKSGKKLFSLNTEYNSSYAGSGGNTGDNCYSMDSHMNAPFVAKCVKLILDDHLAGTYAAPDVLSYWAISDVFDEQPPNNGGSFIENHSLVPFGQVFGLINYQGIRKATFNAFKMLNLMGTTRLSLTGGNGEADGVDGFATINGDSTQVSVMIYNFYKVLSGTESGSLVNLTVNNLPFLHGEVDVSHYRVDESHSNAYGVWVKQGKPSKPTTAQWDEMRAASALAEFRPQSTFNYTGNSYIDSFTLPRQSVSLTLFKKSATAVVDPGTMRREAPALSFLGATVTTSNLHGTGGITIGIFGIDGKLIKRYSTAPSLIDMQKVLSKRGVYLVRAESGGELIMRKFVRME